MAVINEIPLWNFVKGCLIIIITIIIITVIIIINNDNVLAKKDSLNPVTVIYKRFNLQDRKKFF